ncbi:MAG: gamma-glutamyltransferase, partial [Gemmatimonadetes bacterium]|nr:gamma-glutamyltransferase [Gemmatimonadota bacterium]
MFRRQLSFLLIASLALASAAPARDAVYPVLARHAMVVAPEPRAAELGLAVLEQGGNAFDAAVAIGFLLAVTHPLAGNLGGGG